MNSQPQFLEQIDLKNYCTFGIGGPARYFIEINTIEEMQNAITYCNSIKRPYMILGKGSNCLFDDKGFNGAILLNKIDFFSEIAPGTFHVGAGYSFALLGIQTARKGWSGLEFASGIPASVGGAVYMNAGANGGETAQSLASVDYVNEKGELQLFKRAELAYSYRHSPFQQRRGAIVGATFMLKADESARKRQIEIVNQRKQTQPLTSMSAGCVFLNPECGHAGALIDKSGLKGFSIGGAQVSEKHANFLINTGKATCEDMQSLIAHIQKLIKAQSGMDLQTEVRYIGYEPRPS